MVAWVAIYPTITILFLLVGEPLGAVSPLPLRTLLSTVVIAPVMVYVMIPLVQRAAGKWLAR